MPSRIDVSSRKLAGLRVEARERLLGEVVDDVLIAPGERRDRGRAVAGVEQREAGQVETGGPALGARAQQLQIGARELQRERAVEQRAGLLRAEAQRLRGDVDELRRGAQPRDADRRPRARCDRDPDARREVLEQEGHAFVDLGLADHVVVVEHEHELRSRGGERVHERREHDLRRPRAACGECVAEARRDIHARLGDRRQEMRSRSAPGRCRPRRGRARRRRSPSPAAASHSASSVDFPEPAGATSDVSRGRSALASRCSRRSRGTCPARGRGGSIFVTSTAAAVHRRASLAMRFVRVNPRPGTRRARPGRADDRSVASSTSEQE